MAHKDSKAKASSNGAEAAADIADQTMEDFGTGDIPTVDTLEDLEGAASDSEEIAALRAQLAEANRRVEEEHEAFLRARADYANFKRRVQDETAKQQAYAREAMLLRLLPIVDNFERATESFGGTQDIEKLREGVSLILRQMQDFLVKEGVTPIEAVGQPFDPSLHNAVLRHETTEHPENTVVEELQKGYALGDRVLRPSMVKVATGSD